MIVLGIETSGLEGSVAIVRGDECLGEIALNQTGRRHAQSLVLEIRELIRANDISPRELDAVAVSQGPGSFTGLRVGMVCAKTLCYAVRCPILAVDTFQAIATQVPNQFDRVWVVEDAQRADLFVGEYLRSSSGSWTLTAPIQIVSVADFVASRTSEDVVTGPGLRKLNSVEHALQTIDEVTVYRPRASTVAQLAVAALNSPSAATSSPDFWTASPFYLRLSAAEEKHLSNS